ncbi:glycoside hydrolase family 78 protein [Streptomyces triticirhizae]|uniref:alpha-L-rhamnosidase n=1 Tax=Streptomyces triticirhizae TaxID=2483353 RepID=A0A3M2LQ77_9ACTN|nr:glycoside hydrolase family 78 protein [Streptomyces triticirhizae]RMI38703.1 rhamnosidase [Streptomyces triticirhizae]
MISRRQILATTTAAAATAAAPLPGLTPAAAARPREPSGERPAGQPLHVASTTTEYADRPLGLDVEQPRLSWTLESAVRGQRQTAYQIRVASSPALLDSPDIWDSGKRPSDQSVLVPYDGPPPQPRRRHHWWVRVWDADDVASEWSEPTWWETGPGGAGEWGAAWVGAPAELGAAPGLADAHWVWFPGDPDEAPAATRWLRLAFDLGDEPVVAAEWVVAADDGFTAWVNGVPVGTRPIVADQDSWRDPARIDVTAELRAGRNALAVEAGNATTGPAGLLAVLEVTTGAGTSRRLVTGEADWLSTDAEPADEAWRAPEFEPDGWQPARVRAPWGGAPWGEVHAQRSPVLLRRSFTLPSAPVAGARLYATALGLYEARLNGQRVGDAHLTPGWTDYRHRVAYQAYDVTEQVRAGENALGFTLAPGWYAGHIAWFGQRRYGELPSLLTVLEVTYQDGRVERVASDGSWRAATGPWLVADLIHGEEYDARREAHGWDAPGFDDGAWRPVVPTEVATPEVVRMVDEPTRVVSELPAVSVAEVRPGVHLFDLGQNMVGWVRLRVTGEAGTRVTLRHGEVLDREGRLYTENLRTARAQDVFTLAGGGEEVFEPRFTFHGFRYVEITGLPGTPGTEAVTGRVAHTAAPFTMEFSTNLEMVNQLHRNITWGQRGNFLSVPTDTPARDERLGWTGDINVFAPTACYVMESARFLTKWLTDLRDGQPAEGPDRGGFPDVAPAMDELGLGVAGWGDAGVTVPTSLHRAYGDERVLAENWPAMTAWIDYLVEHSEGLVRPAEGYGDWLNVEDETPRDVIGTAYFAHAAALVAGAARVLGHDPAPYEELFARVRDAFNAAFVGADGRIAGDTQTGCVLALSMDLLPSPALRASVLGRLVELVEARGDHLSTGFLGTPRLLPTLTEAGRVDVAYRLLEQDTFPSWGYQIANGATTMWERWDSITPDGGFQTADMNSFNHYAYGAVGEWLYGTVAGIAPGAPGFRVVTVRPRPGGGVTTASGRFRSPYGTVATRWALGGDGTFTLDVEVPVNATAEVWVPAERGEQVERDGATFERMADGCAVFTTGSGRYRFAVAAG